MGKATGKGKRGAPKSAPKARLHPVVEQARNAGLPDAQLQRFTHVVALVPNPYGEVTVQGEIRQHKACRRLPHFETLYRSKVIDYPTYAVLDWYSGRLGLAHAGLFKSGLDVSGSGGGSVFSHNPKSVASVEARADVDWALGFVPAGLHAVLDGVMLEGETFEALGPRLYPALSGERARRKAAADFRAAAAALLLGIGHRINQAIAA